MSGFRLGTEIKWHGDKAILAGHDVSKKTNWEIGIYLSNDAKLFCTVNTGLLRGSIMMRDKDHAVKGNSAAPDISVPVGDTVHVGTALPYAFFVEYGTGPHKTSNKSDQFIISITDWAKKKGFADAGGLIRSIRRKGTKPHPFMRPAFDRAMGRDVDVVADKARKIFTISMDRYLKK